MNPDKTELICFGSRTGQPSDSGSFAYKSSLTVMRDVVQGANAVLDLEVTLDSELSMQSHVNKVARTCFCHIRRLKQV